MTRIEWTDETWNPVRGCSRVSEGCRHCYAERMAARFSTHALQEDDEPGSVFAGFARMTPQGPRWTGRVELIPDKLDEPLRWRKPRRVFVNSMSDLFHEKLPFAHIESVFRVMALAERHTFQVLTKRPEGMREFCLNRSRKHGDTLLPNVWLGVSCEDQRAVDERIPLLLQTPAAVRFVSLEPLLGPINFRDGPLDPDSTMGTWSNLDGLDWVIVGGESGPGARPCDVAWVRSIRDQCKAAGVPVFIKQLGARVTCDLSDKNKAWFLGGLLGHRIKDGRAAVNLKNPKGGDPSEWPSDLHVREFPS